MKTKRTLLERVIFLSKMFFEYLKFRENKTLKEKITRIINDLYQYFIWRKGTGALDESEVGDYRDVYSDEVLTTAKRLPKTYINKLIDEVKVIDQKDDPICVPSAMNTQLSLAYLQFQNKIVNFDIPWSYAMSRWIAKIPKHIGGSYGYAMAMIYKKYGALPTNQDLDFLKISNYELVNRQSTKQEIIKAREYKINNYVFVNPNNLDDIKRAILEFGSVSITVKASDIWPRINGYHRMLLVGWENDNLLGLRNSWGSKKLVKIPFEKLSRMYPIIALIIDKKYEKKIKKIVDKKEKQVKDFKKITPIMRTLKNGYKIGKNFAVKEYFVGKNKWIYDRFGENAIKFIDPRMLEIDQALRQKFGAIKITSGFDTGAVRGVNSLSAHKLGKASDKIFLGVKANVVREWIKKGGWKALPYNIRIEENVSWLHTDVLTKQDKKKEVIFFNK